MGQQNPVPLAAVGVGVADVPASLLHAVRNGAGMMDKTFDMDRCKVFVDALP